MAEQNFNYHEVVKEMRGTFNSNKTKSLEFRLKQLNGFLKLLDTHKEDLLGALHEDLRKPKVEASLMEFNTLRGEVLDGAWNYPLLLACQPVIGAIAAGNCVILKPSEISPATASILAKLIPRYLNNDCYKVINGGVPETTALIKERFDYIFYTGGTAVGRIIMRAAAEYLTPVTLELGGKSPVYVHDDCDLSITANRIVWAKFVNVGQTCLAPDYVLCRKDIQDKLIKCMKETILKFYGKDPKESPDLGRIINARHFNRLTNLINESKVVCGGQTDEDSKYIAPTIMTNVTSDDNVMKEEIFGPILPIVTIDNEDDCIRFIKEREKPLALYIFSKNKSVVDKIRYSTSSGSVCINDCLVQAGVSTLPFGGVGESGMGAYHSKFTFETFSHRKSCLIKKQALEKVEGIRYPPFANSPMRFLNWAMTPSRRFSISRSLSIRRQQTISEATTTSNDKVGRSLSLRNTSESDQRRR